MGNYGQNSSLVKSDKIDFSAIEKQVNTTSADSAKWGEAFKSDNFFISAGAIVSYTIWGVSKLIWGSVVTFFTIIFDGAMGVLGIPPIVTGTLMAILVIVLIFSIWRSIKQG